MKDVHLPLREIELIAATRFAFGFGCGLLAASYLSSPKQQWVGWTLALIGGLSTFPLRTDVLRRRAGLPYAQNQPLLAAHD